MRVATFNLFNYSEPPMRWYRRSNLYSGPVWAAKQAWIAERLQALELDIVGFQEVFSVEALRSLAASAGLPHFIAAADPPVSDADPQVFTRPVVALASRFPITAVHPLRVEPDLIEFLRLPADFGFSRPPLAAEVDVPRFPGLMVQVLHLKSKRPVMEEVSYPETMEWHDQVADSMRRISRGQIASLLQRGAEAAAVYADLTARMRAEPNRPVIVLGDLNDDDRSVTLESLQMARQVNGIGGTSLRSAEPWQRAALHSFRFRDVWGLAPQKSDGPRPETFRFLGQPSVIDYILVSNGLNELNRTGWIGRPIMFDVDNLHIRHINGRWDRADPAKSDHGIPYAEFAAREGG